MLYDKNFQILLLKTLMLLDFLIFTSRFSHPFIDEGEKEFSKTFYFMRSWGIFCEFLVKYLVFVGWTSWKRSLGDVMDGEIQNLLTFSLNVPINGSITANVTLYLIDLIFWWSDIMHFLNMMTERKLPKIEELQEFLFVTGKESDLIFTRKL